MTQYPPNTFFLQRIFQAIEVVLQTTRLQTRGPNAGGIFSRHYITDTSTQAYFVFFILFINQPNLCPSFKCCVKEGPLKRKIWKH